MAPKSKKASRSKKLKPSFSKLNIAVTGNFGPLRDPEKMKNWVILRGGQVDNEVTERTTHLICTIADYQRNAPNGRFGRMSYPEDAFSKVDEQCARPVCTRKPAR